MDNPPPTVLVIVGTRPEAVKLLPVIRHLATHSSTLKVAVLSSGQHVELLRDWYAHLDIVGDLETGLAGSPLTALVGEIVARIGKFLVETSPSAVIVQGDTATAFGGALAAALMQIPVFHVEAGLRTYDNANPFPEEMLRQAISRFANTHFAPTQRAAENLKSEGIDDERIFITGNTVVDALEAFGAQPLAPTSVVRGLPYEKRRVILCTMHRRENLGEPMRQIVQDIARLHDAFEDLYFFIPAHPNPLARRELERLRNKERVLVSEPVSYREILEVLSRCWLVLTDSGGLQEEAPSYEKFTLILRSRTERPEGIACGIARLIGTNVFSEVQRCLHDNMVWPAGQGNPYGDGRAGRRIANTIATLIRGGEPHPKDAGWNGNKTES